MSQALKQRGSGFGGFDRSELCKNVTELLQVRVA